MTLDDSDIKLLLHQAAKNLLEHQEQAEELRFVLLRSTESPAQTMAALTMFAAACGASSTTEEHWESAYEIQARLLKRVYERQFGPAEPKKTPLAVVH
jgi:hypothetical protein